MSKTSVLPCNTYAAPLKYPSAPMSFIISGVVNRVPWVCPRCCPFLLIRISSIVLGYVIVFYYIVLNFGMLFQSVKSLGTSICLSPGFRFSCMWNIIGSWVFLIFPITIIFRISLPLEYYPSISRAIRISCRFYLGSSIQYRWFLVISLKRPRLASWNELMCL